MRGLALALVALVPGPVLAHALSDGFVSVERSGDAIAGSVQLELRDLHRVVDLDPADDGEVTGEDLLAAAPQLRAYLSNALVLSTSSGACPPDVGAPGAVERDGRVFARLPFSARCGVGDVTFRYAALFEVDPQHRALAEVNGEAHFLSPSIATVQVAPASSARASAGAMVVEGVRHIWGGPDHLLFLLALLVPAVLRRRDERWQPVDRFGDSLRDVAKTVSAFTVAHSITLCLAATGRLELPVQFVESAIAFSVVLAALNNLRPVVGAERWSVAFALGLLHGFGFSSAMAESGLARDASLFALLSFNVGVEVGQLAVVAALFPLMFFARRSAHYAGFFLRASSAVILLVAAVWLVERVFSLSLLG